MRRQLVMASDHRPDGPGPDRASEPARSAQSPGSGDAFDGAFRCCHQKLIAWLMPRTRDRLLAEDVAAEAFERLLREIRSDRAPIDRSAWLRRVALNLLISRARRAQVAERRMGSLLRPSARADPTLDTILDRERWAASLAALDRLPPQQRSVLLLAALEMPPRQMAAALGMRPGAARTRLHRARVALRRSAQRDESRPGPTSATTDVQVG